MCGPPPHRLVSPTPIDSVDRSWSLLLPLLQLPLQELLSSSMNPGELVYEELGDMLCLHMLLFFSLLWERLQPAETEVEVGVVVGVVVVVVIGLLTPTLIPLRLQLPLLTTLPPQLLRLLRLQLLLQTLLLPHRLPLPEERDITEGEAGDWKSREQGSANSVEGCGVVEPAKESTLNAGREGGEEQSVEELEETIIERDGRSEGGEPIRERRDQRRHQ